MASQIKVFYSLKNIFKTPVLLSIHTTIAGDALTAANEDFKKAFISDSYLALARDIALYHHEKWNGKGYPKGLKGESIPLSARIVAVADVYDALRNKWPYKESWPHLKAVDQIVLEKGEQFDPEIINAFISQLNKFHTISKTVGGLHPQYYNPWRNGTDGLAITMGEAK